MRDRGIFRAGHFLKIAVTEIDCSSLLDAFGHRCQHGALHEIYLWAVHRCHSVWQ